MPEGTPVAALLPDRPTLSRLREAAAGCRACDLWRDATRTVFGEGRKRAEPMMVGEQPGDREDVEGHPLVGPAGPSWTAGWRTPGSTAIEPIMGAPRAGRDAP